MSYGDQDQNWLWLSESMLTSHQWGLLVLCQDNFIRYNSASNHKINLENCLFTIHSSLSEDNELTPCLVTMYDNIDIVSKATGMLLHFCVCVCVFFYLRPSSSTNGIFRLSVRLSICPSVRHTFLTMFPSSYHHEIFRSYYQWPK